MVSCWIWTPYEVGWQLLTTDYGLRTNVKPRLLWAKFASNVSTVKTVEQIERVIEQLPAEDFEKLSAWMEQRRCVRSAPYPPPAGTPLFLRDHQGFLNSYAPEDEGIYDDAASR